MSIVIIDTDAFDPKMKKLNAIEEKITVGSKELEELWLDNEQL